MLRINVEKHKLPSKCFLSHLSETSLVIIPNYFRLNPFIIISFASPGNNGVFNGCCFFPPLRSNWDVGCIHVREKYKIWLTF